MQRAIEPAIGALTARSGNPVKPQHLAVDFNAGQHGGEDFGFGGAEHAHRVTPRNLIARMGEAMRELAVIGEQHEATGREVQPTHHHPAPRGGGQQLKNSRAPFRVVAGTHHIGRLVHTNHPPGASGSGLGVARLAVDRDAVADINALAQYGGLVVHGDATGAHQRLDFAA
jgi:hypothetical protein